MSLYVSLNLPHTLNYIFLQWLTGEHGCPFYAYKTASKYKMVEDKFYSVIWISLIIMCVGKHAILTIYITEPLF